MSSGFQPGEKLIHHLTRKPASLQRREEVEVVYVQPSGRVRVKTLNSFGDMVFKQVSPDHLEKFEVAS